MTSLIKEFDKGSKFIFANEVQYNDNAIVSKNVLKKEKGNISLFAFDKGQSLSEHTAPFDAMVQVIEGTAEVLINGESHMLTAGETIIMPANVPHAVKAEEKFKMVLTMIKA